MTNEAKQVVIGCEYNWWRGDHLPDLAPLPGFSTKVVKDKALLARLHGLDEAEMQARFDEGAHCYVAYLDEEPAGYGWVGTKVGHIRDAQLEWPLGEQDRLLWDFATLEAYRGRGVYPHLLQEILRAEVDQNERFWIGHQGQNEASQRGIQKAGFILHDRMLLTSEGEVIFQRPGDGSRAAADPMLPAAKAMIENMPEAARQGIYESFAHLFESEV